MLLEERVIVFMRQDEGASYAIGHRERIDPDQTFRGGGSTRGGTLRA
jgi:hypothetical protein